MKIILADNTELNPFLVTGGLRHVQGESRDTLSFIFPANADMAALDSAFTTATCEKITIIGDDGNEFIHKGYTIRVELSKAHVEVTPATESEQAVYEDRITVAISQRTYAESQLASLTDTVDTLVMEALM